MFRHVTANIVPIILFYMGRGWVLLDEGMEGGVRKENSVAKNLPPPPQPVYATGWEFYKINRCIQIFIVIFNIPEKIQEKNTYIF